MKKKRLPVTNYLPDEHALERLVSLLNDGKYQNEQMDESERVELRELVTDLLTAEGHWERFIEARLRTGKSVSFVNGRYNIPSNGPSPILVPYPDKRGSCEYVYGVFTQFILHPCYRQLAGPCRRPQCGRYFLRETMQTVRPKVYCQKRCATLNTATKAMSEKRAELRGPLIAEVNAAIRKYERDRNRRGDWKVSVQIETEILPRTLTAWVKKGYIQAPAERKGKA